MIELRSKIDEVRVFRAAAEITRIAEIARIEGAFPKRVALVGLPLALDDSSVRVRIVAEDGAAGPIARDARIALDASFGERVEPAPDEREARSARESEASIRASVIRLQSELERIESATVAARPKSKRGERPSASPTFARLELGAFVRERATALADELAAARDALTRATEQRAEAEARLARASSSREAKPDELRKAVVVTLAPASTSNDDTEPRSAERVTLVVTYTVPGARWAPAYTLRVAEAQGAKRQVELAMRAVVCQRTGEDWRGVRLSLSTANPTRWTELLELSSLRVGRAQASTLRRGWRPLPQGVEALFEDFDRATSLIDARHPPPAQSSGSVSELAFDGARPIARGARVPAPEMGAMEVGAFADDAPAMLGYGAPQGAPAGGSPPIQSARPRIMAPMGMAMPMSASVPMAKRGGGVLGAFGGAVGGALDALSPSSAREEQASVAVVREGALRAEARMLQFGSLRMASASDARRGTLTVISERETYLELRIGERSLLHVDIDGALDAASSLARATLSLPPPPRHHAPDAVDGFDHAYASESPADIPSDGVFHSIPVLTTKAEARMHYVTVPRESRDVFRHAEIPSQLDAPLLAGPLEVYVGRDFLLSTDLATVAPRGKIKLGLGVEPAIKVARNTDFGEQVTGLMRGSLDLRHEIRVEIANNRAEAVDVEVRERLPTVRDKEEDIRVEVLSVEPRWEPYEQDETKLLGGHLWRVVVEPGAKTKLEASYVVRIAAKNELVGGNRREST